MKIIIKKDFWKYKIAYKKQILDYVYWKSDYNELNEIINTNITKYILQNLDWIEVNDDDFKRLKVLYLYHNLVLPKLKKKYEYTPKFNYEFKRYNHSNYSSWTNYRKDWKFWAH